MECDYCRNEIETAKHRQYTGGNFDVIKETVPLPFICRRCGGSFCADHRLPETHDCIGLLDNSKFHISDELKEDIMEHQISDIPQSTPYENRTPDDFVQYVIEKQKVPENSSEVNKEIGLDMEKTNEQNTNAIRCDFCGEDIAKGGNQKGSYYSGGTKDIYYKPIQLPFKCHRCNGTFCVDHRLPESHFCTGSYREHTRYSIDKKTRILIAIIIAIFVALYIILFSN